MISNLIREVLLVVIYVTYLMAHLGIEKHNIRLNIAL